MQRKLLALTIIFLLLSASGMRRKKKSKQAENVPVVIDYDDLFFKVGFAGEEGPRSVFPAIIGRPKVPGIMVGLEQEEYYVGVEAQAKSSNLVIGHPIEHGLVVDWDDFEKILAHIFENELRILPEEHTVLISEDQSSDDLSRAKVASILFETFNVPAIQIVNRGVLNLYSVGKSTGINIGLQSTVTKIIAVKDGRSIPDSLVTFSIGFTDLNDYMLKIFSERGHYFTTSDEREIVADILKKTAYVAYDFEQELSNARNGQETAYEITYEMPDASVINVGTERFRTPEALFKPSMIGKEFAGLPKQIYDSIMKCDPAIQNDMFQNIILSGMNSRIPGLAERLRKEVQKLSPNSSSVTVRTSPNEEYSSWIGGSIFAMISDNQDYWVTNDQYANEGSEVINKFKV